MMAQREDGYPTTDVMLMVDAPARRSLYSCYDVPTGADNVEGRIFLRPIRCASLWEYDQLRVVSYQTVSSSREQKVRVLLLCFSDCPLARSISLDRSSASAGRLRERRRPMRTVCLLDCLPECPSQSPTTEQSPPTSLRRLQRRRGQSSYGSPAGAAVVPSARNCQVARPSIRLRSATSSWYVRSVFCLPRVPFSCTVDPPHFHVCAIWWRIVPYTKRTCGMAAPLAAYGIIAIHALVWVFSFHG
ncbi:hypothetical protein OH77DRAFT_676677 [Trametes cingulata]|nr:hypothetical protein OH77DRAFT_676677 [Trametes cingulata]